MGKTLLVWARITKATPAKAEAFSGALCCQPPRAGPAPAPATAAARGVPAHPHCRQPLLGVMAAASAQPAPRHTAAPTQPAPRHTAAPTPQPRAPALHSPVPGKINTTASQRKIPITHHLSSKQALISSDITLFYR